MKPLLLLLLFTAYAGNAQNDKPQREPFTLKLAVDNEQFYEMDVDKTPYFVADKVLQIFPGETVFIETEIKADTIATMKVVKTIKFPERTIVVDFKQVTEKEGRAHKRMTLEVKNPFDKYLNYTAQMYVVGNDTLLNTSIIPVYPKIMGIEMWQDVIISIALHHWRFEKP